VQTIVQPTGLGTSLVDSLPKFRRYLVAENKAERTIDGYTEAVRLPARFCGERGMPVHVEAVTREHVEAFIADQVERLRPASARNRFLSLRARKLCSACSSRTERRSRFCGSGTPIGRLR
jgi:Phage integrase, N-terminal SAM-like domain